MMLRVLIFCALLCGAVVGRLSAQTGELRLRLSSPKGPVKAVTVWLDQKPTATHKTAPGQFRISDVAFGRHFLQIFREGYHSIRDTFRLSQAVAERSYRLRPLSGQTDEVLVEGKKQNQSDFGHMKSVEGFTINEGRKSEAIQMEKVNANKASNNPRQIYGKVAGLNIWESDGAGLQLGIGGRGLSPNRTSNFNVRQNGYDIAADALGYPETYYTPPAEATERIEIIRGAAALQYGTQFGGLLNFDLKDGPKDEKLALTSRQTGGSFGFFNSFNSVGGTVADGKLNYYGYYQYKRRDGWRPNSAFDLHSAYGHLNYQLSPNISVGAEYTFMNYLAQQPGGLTDRQFATDPAQSRRPRNWFQVDWNLFALTADFRLSESTKINIRNFGLLASRSAAGNLQKITETDLGGQRDLIHGEFDNIGSETRLLHHYQIMGQPAVGLAGVRLYRGHTISSQGFADATAEPSFDFVRPEPTKSRYENPNTNVAAFAENIFNLTDKLSVTPGLRFEYIRTASAGFHRQRVKDQAGNIVAEQKIEDSRLRERSFVLAGVGVSYRPGDSAEVYANLTQNYRSITFTDLRVQNPNFKVDPNIQDERGYTADLGFRGHWGRFFRYDLSAFFLNYDNRIGVVHRADDPPLFLDQRVRTNIADANIYGIESLVEVHPLGLLRGQPGPLKTTLYANTSFIRSRYINSEDRSINSNQVELVPEVLFRSGASASYKGFRASLQFSFTGEQFTDGTNALRTSTAVDGLVPQYGVLDLTASYSFRRYKLELSGNNLTDEDYFTRRASSYPGPGIIPADPRAFYLTLQVKL